MATMTFGSTYRTGENALDLRDLERLEGDVRSGVDGMRRAAIALTEIRDRQLYRSAGYSDFTDYCDERLDGKRSQVYRLISAGEVIRDIETHLTASPTGDATPMPTNERQIRPLAAVKSPEERAEIWKKAVHLAKGERPTEAEVKALVVHGKECLSPEGKKAVTEEQIAAAEALGNAQAAKGRGKTPEQRRDDAIDHARLGIKDAKHLADADEGIRYLEQAIASFTAITSPQFVAV